MCGITGAVGLADEDLLSDMLDTIVHRGPDESGAFVDESVPVMICMRWLSIVDLGGESQPIWNKNKDGMRDI